VAGEYPSAEPPRPFPYFRRKRSSREPVESETRWWMTQSDANPSPPERFPDQQGKYREFRDSSAQSRIRGWQRPNADRAFSENSPRDRNREFLIDNRESHSLIRFRSGNVASVDQETPQTCDPVGERIPSVSPCKRPGSEWIALDCYERVWSQPMSSGTAGWPRFANETKCQYLPRGYWVELQARQTCCGPATVSADHFPARWRT